MNRSFSRFLLGAAALLAGPNTLVPNWPKTDTKREPGRTIRTGLPPTPKKVKEQRRRYYRRRSLNKAPRVCKPFLLSYQPVPPGGMEFVDSLSGECFGSDDKPNKFWSRAALDRMGLKKERHHLPGGRRETTVVSYAQWERNRKHEREELLAA